MNDKMKKKKQPLIEVQYIYNQSGQNIETKLVKASEFFKIYNIEEDATLVFKVGKKYLHIASSGVLWYSLPEDFKLPILIEKVDDVSYG